MDKIDTISIPIKDIQPNRGQLEGLPKNPRQINDASFKKLMKSISDNPEMLALRELLVYPLPNKKGKYIIIGGNMRYRACKELGYTEIPCKVIPADTSVQTLKAYTIKDNGGFGEWDMDLLANEWDNEPLSDWGIGVVDAFEDKEEETDKDNVDKGVEFIVKIHVNSPDEQDAVMEQLKVQGYIVSK